MKLPYELLYSKAENSHSFLFIYHVIFEQKYEINH